MKQFIIKENDAGQRLDKFVIKALPMLPISMLYKAIRQKNLKLNGKRAQIGSRLNAGDIIDIYLKDDVLGSENSMHKERYDFLSAPASLSVIYEDENILLCDKPQGLIVHPDKDNYNDNLLFRIQHYLYNKGEYNPKNEQSFSPALANRIDRGTGGIVIACKTAEALRIMNEKIKQRELSKKYYCLVHGCPKKNSDTIKSYLFKDAKKNRVYITKETQKGAQLAITEYSVLRQNGDISLLDVKIITGRTHQIRAQLASIGYPLVGDGKYGKLNDDKRLGFNRQALYCYKIGFRFSSEAGILEYLNNMDFTVKNVWFVDEF